MESNQGNINFQDLDTFLNLLKRLRTDSLCGLTNLISPRAIDVDFYFISTIQSQLENFVNNFAFESKNIEILILSHQTGFHDQIVMLPQSNVCYFLYLVSCIFRAFNDVDLMAKFLETIPDSILYHKQMGESFQMVFKSTEKAVFDDLATKLHESLKNHEVLPSNITSDILKMFSNAEHIFPLFKSLLELFPLDQALRLFSFLRSFSLLELILFFGLRNHSRIFLQDYYNLFCNSSEPPLFQSQSEQLQKDNQSTSSSIYPTFTFPSNQQQQQNQSSFPYAPSYPANYSPFTSPVTYPQSGFSGTSSILIGILHCINNN
jgi:hypothetical protein